MPPKRAAARYAEAALFGRAIEEEESEDESVSGVSSSSSEECESETEYLIRPGPATATGSRHVRQRGVLRFSETRRNPPTRTATGFVMSDKEDAWLPAERTMPNYLDFTGQPGIQIDTTDFSPLDFVKIFITDDLINLFVEQSNIYAQQFTERKSSKVKIQSE